jgi:hypothetical protein
MLYEPNAERSGMQNLSPRWQGDSISIHRLIDVVKFYLVAVLKEWGGT